MTKKFKLLSDLDFTNKIWFKNPCKIEVCRKENFEISSWVGLYVSEIRNEFRNGFFQI